MRLALAVLAFAAVMAAVNARADIVRATTVNFTPYYGESLEGGGVITALARAAFAERGHEFEVKFQPWRRALAKGRAGAYDAVHAAYWAADRERDFYFSKPFYSIEVGLMAHKDLGLSRFTPLEDLKPYLIGYNAGWAYGEKFENADYLQKDPANNQTINVRKFFAGRVDIVAVARSIFRYEAARIEGADLSEVTFIEPPLKIGRLHMMFPKVNENAEKLRDDFDAGLKAIREKGIYAEIIDRYGF